MTHEEVDGVQVGQHELVSRFMKGIFNCNLPAPRYTSTWDVDIVLEYLSSLPDNTLLPLAALTHRLAMLFALCSANRCSELAALDIKLCSIFENGIKFVIPGLTKTRRKGPPKEMIIYSFSENETLCPVSTFLEYKKRTSKFCSNNKGEDRLFTAVRKPHRPVTSATIGHWIKRILEQSGIDTNIFMAHSTRGAATSKACAVGISIPDILKMADWSSVSTFRRFYHRPITPKFGQAVLSGREFVSSKVSYERYHVVNCVVKGYPEPPKYNFRFLKD